jgi:hypothetical protein
MLDFRSLREKLRPEDFADSDGIDHPPSDPINPQTWRDLTSLADDVSLRTSDQFGTPLSELSALANGWIRVAVALQSMNPGTDDLPMLHASFDVYEGLQASIYGTLSGYYRLAFTSLRVAVENATVCLYFELANNRLGFQEWIAGDEVGFGKAADNLSKDTRVRALEAFLKASVSESLFEQKRVGYAGGLARRMFRQLSKYAHRAPGSSDGAIWESNGPVFAPKAFATWRELFAALSALALVHIQLAYPKLPELPLGPPAMSVIDLFAQTVAQMPSMAADRQILEMAFGSAS